MAFIWRAADASLGTRSSSIRSFHKVAPPAVMVAIMVCALGLLASPSAGAVMDGKLGNTGSRERVAVPRGDVPVPHDGAAVPLDDVAVPRDDVAGPVDGVAVPRNHVAGPRDNAAVPRDGVAWLGDQGGALAEPGPRVAAAGSVKGAGPPGADERDSPMNWLAEISEEDEPESRPKRGVSEPVSDATKEPTTAPEPGVSDPAGNGAGGQDDDNQGQGNKEETTKPTTKKPTTAPEPGVSNPAGNGADGQNNNGVGRDDESMNNMTKAEPETTAEGQEKKATKSPTATTKGPGGAGGEGSRHPASIGYIGLVVCVGYALLPAMM